MIAPKRNQSAGLWFFLTIIFPIAILFIAMKDIDPEAEKRIKDAEKIGKERGEGRINRDYFYPRREFNKIEREYRNKSLDPERPVNRGIIDGVIDFFSERVTPQGDTVQTAQIQKVQTPPLPGTPMPRVQTAQANINPTTNLTPTQEALLSPEEKIIAGRT